MPHFRLRQLLYVEYKANYIATTSRGAKQGGGFATPPEFWKGEGVACLSTPPPLILRGFLFIAHICYYVQVISIGGVGSP